MIILDTDCFSLAQRGTSREAKNLAERIVAEHQHAICVTIITFEEQMRGWLDYVSKAKDEAKRIHAYAQLTEMLLDFAKLRVITYDLEASFHYQRLRVSKLRVGTMDLKIAGITLAHSATLITRNRKDFGNITGIKMKDWTKD